MQASPKLRSSICFVVSLLVISGPMFSTSSYDGRTGLALAMEFQDQPATDNGARQQQESVDEWITRLNDPKTSWSADLALQRIGAAAVPALLENLRQHPEQFCAVGRLNDSERVLIKIGPAAIPSILLELQSDRTEDTEKPELSSSASSLPLPSPARASWFVDRSRLIRLLGDLGPPAIPALIDIAERDAANRVNALDRALGRDYWPTFDFAHDPWSATGPRKLDRDQRAAHFMPLIPRIKRMLEKALKDSPPSDGTPHTALAAILAMWGDPPSKAAAVSLLLELAKTLPSAHSRRRPLALLVEFRIGAAADLIRRSIPSKAEDDLADQIQLEAARQLHLLGDPSYYKLVVPLFASDNLWSRRNAIDFAAKTLDLRFVPDLIKRLDDTTPTGTQTAGPGNESRQEEFREPVLRALERLTLQQIAGQPELWRAWCRQNESVTRGRLVQIEVSRMLSRFDATPFWKWNDWMNRLEGTYDSAVIPLIRRYVNSPLVNVRATGRYSGWGGCCEDDSWPWGYSPPAVTLLLGLSRNGNREATKLLYDCLDSVDREIRQLSAIAISTFDRKTGLDFLVHEMKEAEQWAAREAATLLVRLGDARGVAGLIRFLQDSDSDAGRSLTYGVLREFTQEEIDYNPDGDPEEREAGVQRWWAWWRENEKTFQVKVHAARLDRANHTIYRQSAALKGQ
jgi:HEAT repeat protein